MKIIVKNARLSFNDLFTAKAIKGGAPRFSATLICLDGSDASELQTTITYKNSEGNNVTKDFSKMSDICEHVMKEKWGKVPKKIDNWCFNKADGSTTRAAFTNDEDEFYAGFNEETFYIVAAKQEERCINKKMTVLDQRRDPIEPSSGLIFSGCYVNAVIDVYPYDNETGKGVTASLEGIQLKKKGDALGFTQIDAADEFDEEEFDEDETDADDLL